MAKRSMRCNTQRATRRMDRILELLAEGESMSARELSEKLFCATSMTTTYLSFLMDEPKRVFIAGHDIINSRVVPLYALGDKPNKRYKSITYKQRWAALKKDRPEQYEAMLEKKRQGNRARRAKLPPEQIKVVRKKFERPLSELIVEVLERRAGRTSVQIAGDLGASHRTVQAHIQALRAAGRVRRAAGPATSREPFRWEVPTNPAFEAPPRVKQKQSIFAALGL